MRRRKKRKKSRGSVGKLKTVYVKTPVLRPSSHYCASMFSCEGFTCEGLHWETEDKDRHEDEQA